MIELQSQEKAEELSIAEYMEVVQILFRIDSKFMQDFMLLVDRDDF